MAKKAKRIVVANEFDNKKFEIILMSDDNTLCYIQCPTNVRLQKFLMEIIENISEADLGEAIRFYFKRRCRTVEEMAAGWKKGNNIKEKEVKKTSGKRVAGVACVYKMRPFARLEYILQHYKACRGIQLDYALTDTAVTLQLSVAKIAETAGIVDGDVNEAKDKAAEAILKRLGF